MGSATPLRNKLTAFAVAALVALFAFALVASSAQASGVVIPNGNYVAGFAGDNFHIKVKNRRIKFISFQLPIDCKSLDDGRITEMTFTETHIRSNHLISRDGRESVEYRATDSLRRADVKMRIKFRGLGGRPTIELDLNVPPDSSNVREHCYGSADYSLTRTRYTPAPPLPTS